MPPNGNYLSGSSRVYVVVFSRSVSAKLTDFSLSLLINIKGFMVGCDENLQKIKATNKDSKMIIQNTYESIKFYLQDLQDKTKHRNSFL